jgi:transcriptional regulator with XRE-family HTH domain
MNRYDALMTPEQVRERLRGIRKASGLRQSDVALPLGLTHHSVSLKEAGKRPITLDELGAWCAALGVPLHVHIGEAADEDANLSRRVCALLQVIPLPVRQSLEGFVGALESQYLTEKQGNGAPEGG